MMKIYAPEYTAKIREAFTDALDEGYIVRTNDIRVCPK